MRTTITLDPDVEALVKQAMKETGRGLKAVVNDSLRELLEDRVATDEDLVPVFDLGEPLIDINRAIEILDEIEDAKLVEQMRSTR